MMRCFDDEVFSFFLLVVLLAGSLGCDSGAEDGLPAIPRTSFPTNGATDQANALELQWHPSSDAHMYHVQVSVNVDFSNNKWDESGLTATYLALKALDIGTTYYWHVRAHNAAGFSDWSSPWRFTPTSVAVAPATLGLKRPTHGATSQPTTIMFEWTASPGASTYHLQVALESDFLRRVADLEGVRYTNQQVTGLVNTYTYYWRVRAGNPVGYGAWSSTRSFVVEGGD